MQLGRTNPPPQGNGLVGAGFNQQPVVKPVTGGYNATLNVQCFSTASDFLLEMDI